MKKVSDFQKLQRQFWTPITTVHILQTQANRINNSQQHECDGDINSNNSNSNDDGSVNGNNRNNGNKGINSNNNDGDDGVGNTKSRRFMLS